MNGASLAEFFQDFLEFGDDVAYVHRRGYRTERWTYKELYWRAAEFAKELEARGLGKGQRILLWGENCAEWVAVFFGCVLRGVVVVPMDDGANADFVERVAREVDVRLVVCSRKHASHSIAVEGFILEDLGKASDSRPKVNPVSLGGNDPLQIIFTSGTTAEPKGVVITHGNVLANLAPLESEIRKYLKYERWVRNSLSEPAASESRLWPVPCVVPAPNDGRHRCFS
jgi:long-chain acyl-CoA synthetase